MSEWWQTSFWVNYSFNYSIEAVVSQKTLVLDIIPAVSEDLKIFSRELSDVAVVTCLFVSSVLLKQNRWNRISLVFISRCQITAAEIWAPVIFSCVFVALTSEIIPLSLGCGSRFMEQSVLIKCHHKQHYKAKDGSGHFSYFIIPEFSDAFFQLVTTRIRVITRSFIRAAFYLWCCLLLVMCINQKLINYTKPTESG